MSAAFDKIEVLCGPEAERLLGKRIRVQTDDFDGYGHVETVYGHTTPFGSANMAVVVPEISDEKTE